MGTDWIAFNACRDAARDAMPKSRPPDYVGGGTARASYDRHVSKAAWVRRTELGYVVREDGVICIQEGTTA